MSPVVEICCGSYYDARQAALGGAERIELNAALMLGGLTPTAATVRMVKENLELKVVAMVRPRGAGFCYLEEEFAVSLNDVDFCLKLREKGLLNVFTPFAELYHYESASRGLDTEGERARRYDRESEAFRQKWKAALEAGDPYFNPNFSLDRSDFSLKI